MISFWVNAAGSFGMEQYLLQRAPDLADRIQLRSYESLSPELEVTDGAHIFSALDQLSPGGREALAALYDGIAERCPGARLLNDPRRVLLRYDLLARACDEGINRFRAYRAIAADAARFPVFLREESGHTGALTRLLKNRSELASAIVALRVRGYRIADLLVVEFCDLSDSEGRVRMASAYKVGDRIVPAFLLGGRRWMLKWTDSDHDERAMQEFLEYVGGNPHESWLRRMFALAGVDYGRIDYGVCGEERQLWEINLNPTVGPSGGPPPAPLAPKLEAMLQEGRRVYLNGMREAFRALDPECGSSRVTLRLDPDLLAPLRLHSARTLRRRGALRLLQRVYRHPQLGWPFRAAYSWLMPRP